MYSPSSKCLAKRLSAAKRGIAKIVDVPKFIQVGREGGVFWQTRPTSSKHTESFVSQIPRKLECVNDLGVLARQTVVEDRGGVVVRLSQEVGLAVVK